MWTVPLKAIFCHVVSDLCWGYTGKDIMTIVPDTHSDNNGSIKINVDRMQSREIRFPATFLIELVIGYLHGHRHYESANDP